MTNPKPKPCECLARWAENGPECLGFFIPKSPHQRYCQYCRKVAERCASRKYYWKDRSGYRRLIGSIQPCDCGCGLTYAVTSNNQRYSPKCAQKAYRVNQIKKRSEERRKKRKRDFKKDVPTIKPKSKRKTCSCGCGKPVGKDLRLLSDYCYKRSSDLSERAHWHTKRQGMAGWR